MNRKIICFSIALFLLLGGLAYTETNPKQAALAPGAVFRDCPTCPEMVVIPKGSFTMGSDEKDRERPQHRVTFGSSFAVGIYEVTLDEWDACLKDGGCNGYIPGNSGIGLGRNPVTHVSWSDAQTYVFWLTKKTGYNYRLLSESEWEYVARAGSTTRFWWGDDLGEGHGNCFGCGSQWDNKQTAPVGSFQPNKFGVYDTVGNVTEWVQDRWNATYDGAPADGSAWETGEVRKDKVMRVMRGGSWFNNERLQRSAFRNGDSPFVRNAKIGFRVARKMNEEQKQPTQ